jgi:hypothetical protein
MTKFKVQVTTTVTTVEQFEVDVDGTDEHLAYRAAEKLRPKPDHPNTKQRIDILKQLDGPWVRPGYGGELWYIHQTPIIVVAPSFGNVLTRSDIKLLKSRLAAEGIIVEKHWASEMGVSLQCTERKPDPMPADMVARILAPRPS